MNEIDKNINCLYKKDGICCLTLKKCRKEKTINNCKLKDKVKENQPFKDVYEIAENITCKNCGSNVAYQLVGRLYPNGLPKSIILKHPQIYGKYYNRTYLSPAIGFGGTIPYKCSGCGKEGLIEISLEGYDNLFIKKSEE